MFLKALLKIPLQNSKVIMQCYVDSENFMNKTWNLIEFYSFDRNKFRQYYIS